MGVPATPEAESGLAELLRCPGCGHELAFHDASVACAGGSHSFPVVDGIPVLVDERALARDPQYARQRMYFDAEFSAYLRYELEPWRISYLRRLRAARILDGRTAPLVDVGVGGSGYTVIEAARSGKRAIGCDLSLEALVRARRFAAKEGVVERTLWVCCSAERLPLASCAFGSAVSVAVYEHVPDDIAALREAARVLEPGGRLWVTVPHALRNVPRVLRPPNRRHDRRLGHLRRYESEELAARGASVGLTPIAVQFTGHPIKVLQLAAGTRPSGSRRRRFWWWCEARDLRRAAIRRGSMQLSVLFRRA